MDIFRVEDVTYLSKERFIWLFGELRKLGCYERSWQDTLNSLRKSKTFKYLRFIKRTKGRQVIFEYKANDKTVIICTTYDPLAGRVKRTGSGWVLIIDPRQEEPALFSFELRRTRNFIPKLLATAKSFIEIVDKWPKCPETGEDLCLKTVQGIMHMREFTCFSRHTHKGPRPHFWVIDMELSPENFKTLITGFENFYRYRAKDENTDRQYRRVLRSIQNRKSIVLQRKKFGYSDTENEVKEEQQGSIYASDHNSFLEDGKYYD